MNSSSKGRPSQEKIKLLTLKMHKDLFLPSEKDRGKFPALKNASGCKKERLHKPHMWIFIQGKEQGTDSTASLEVHKYFSPGENQPCDLPSLERFPMFPSIPSIRLSMAVEHYHSLTGKLFYALKFEWAIQG